MTTQQRAGVSGRATVESSRATRILPLPIRPTRRAGRRPCAGGWHFHRPFPALRSSDLCGVLLRATNIYAFPQNTAEIGRTQGGGAATQGARLCPPRTSRSGPEAPPAPVGISGVPCGQPAAAGAPRTPPRSGKNPRGARGFYRVVVQGGRAATRAERDRSPSPRVGRQRCGVKLGRPPQCVKLGRPPQCVKLGRPPQ